MPLAQAKQQALAQAIRDGEDATTAARRSLVAAADKSVAATAIYRRLLKAVSDALDELEGHIDEIEVRDALVDEHIETLQRAVPLLRQLIRYEQTTNRRRMANTKRLLGKLASFGETGD